MRSPRCDPIRVRAGVSEIRRIGFAGTSERAADTLRRLHARDELEVAIVLSQPPRPAGRGRATAPPPVAVAARALDLPVLQPERPLDALPALASARVAAFALVAYGGLVPRPLLELAPWFNVHPSLLPRWRGAAPIERSLMAGERESGVAVMLLVEALDAGPIAALERFDVPADADAGWVYEQALGRAIDPLVAALTGDAVPTVPQVGEATYADRILAADRLLDPARRAGALHDQVRALSPSIGARLALGDALFTIWRARVDPAVVPQGVLSVVDGALLLGCLDGSLELCELQPPGKARMPAGAWLRGVRGALPEVS